MAQIVWSGTPAVEGSWNDASQWMPAIIPTSGDDVVLGAGASVIDASGPIAMAHSLTLDGATAVITLDQNDIPIIHIVQGELGIAALSNATVDVGPQGTLSALSIADSVIYGVDLAVPSSIGGTVIFRSPVGVSDFVPTVRNLLPSGAGPAQLDGGYITLVGGLFTQPPFLSFTAATIQNDLLPGNIFTLGPNLTVNLTFHGTLIQGSTGTGAAPSIFMDGLVNLTPGVTAEVNGAVANSGTIAITSATLMIQNASQFGGVIRFADTAGVVDLQSAQVAATLSGFRTGDAIDLPAIAYGGAALAIVGNTLGVTEGGASAAQLVLQDQTAGLALTSFSLAPDSTGGTLISTALMPAATLSLSDTTNGDSGILALDPVGTGAPGFLQHQYLDTSADTVALTVNAPNTFVHGGTGEKSLTVLSGTNVLDGGTGSSFLTGGSGNDTFFVDVRSANAFVWDTINNFHAGDVLTIWGYQTGISQSGFTGQQGAAGYAGATLAINGTGAGSAKVTFAGLSDFQGSELIAATGTVGGLDYMTVTNFGV